MQSLCPICDASVNLSSDAEISEILSCCDCQSSLVVEALGNEPVLGVAPAIEEDWGE